MTQVVVNKAAGPLDTLYAAIRLLFVIGGTIPLLLKMLGEHNFAAIVAYFQSAEGSAFLAAGGTLIALVWGLIKSFRRGKQLAGVAAHPAVPESIATLKP